MPLALEPNRRIGLQIDGRSFDQFYRVNLTHDMSELASSFELTMRDEIRALDSWQYGTATGAAEALNWGAAVTVTIDGQFWCFGWVDDVSTEAGVSSSMVTISGRDVTGDLVDCPPDPRGKHEYRDIGLDEFARKLCKPFSIDVRCDVDVSPKFDKCVVEAGETVLSALAKYAKQRGVLVTTDRLGTLVITRSGLQRAADDITFPGNVSRTRGGFSGRERFSDYFVKGQSEKNGGKRGKTASLDATAAPLDTAPTTPPPASSDPEDEPEGAGTLVMGHAQDKEVTRWRPFIAMARTKATAFDAQRQAEWEMRTRRGKGDKLDYVHHDFKGSTGRLWTPNTLAAVRDAYAQVERDMLLGGICATYDDRGEATRLRMVGPEAYDLLPEADRRAKTGAAKSKSKSKSSGKLDGTAKPL